MLCQKCLEAIRDLKGLDTKSDDKLTGPHYNNILDLQAAALRGCYMCSAYWNRFTPDEKESLMGTKDIKWPTELSVSRLMYNKYSNLDVWIEYTGRTLPIPREELACATHFLLKPLLQSCSETPSHAPRSSSTASKETWYIARSWFQECCQSHKECIMKDKETSYPTRLLGMMGLAKAVKSEKTWYPTRLLDLHRPKGSVRLIDTKTKRCSGPYATISHRWGQTQPYALCGATSKELYEGISVSKLAQAFQDAITVCLRLDINLLWIDSLCIIQGSEGRQDWLTESELMQQVYSNSCLNISTLAAIDSSKSFFVSRDPDLLKETRVTTSLNLELTELWEEYDVVDLLSGELQEYRIWYDDYWRDEVAIAPLNRRGWVLQERLLAPRVLHFGPQQVMWECYEKHASEVYPSGFPDDMLPNTWETFRFSPLAVSKLPPLPVYRAIGAGRTGVSALRDERYWHSIIEHYTRCALTREEDKLIAVAGLAKQMSRMLDDDYVVGMWRRNLVLELAWMVEYRYNWEERQDSRRPNRYRCPSFSWASVDGTVRYDNYPNDPNVKTMAELIDINLQFVTEDRFGVVKGGSLLLKGQLHSLSLHHHPRHRNAWRYILVVDGIEMYQPEGGSRLKSDPDVFLDEHPKYFDPATADPTSLYCIPLSWQHNYLMILVLQRVGAKQGTFRRIGLTKIDEMFFKESTNRPNVDAQHFPCVSFDGDNHIIRII